MADFIAFYRFVSILRANVNIYYGRALNHLKNFIIGSN